MPERSTTRRAGTAGNVKAWPSSEPPRSMWPARSYWRTLTAPWSMHVVGEVLRSTKSRGRCPVAAPSDPRVIVSCVALQATEVAETVVADADGCEVDVDAVVEVDAAAVALVVGAVPDLCEPAEQPATPITIASEAAGTRRFRITT